MLQHACLGDFKLKETGVVTPASNTGVPKRTLSLRPDYLTATISESYLNSKPLETANFLFRKFARNMEGGTSMEKRNGRQGFENGIYLIDPFGKEMAALLWGGKNQRQKAYIELKGGICKLLNEFDWMHIYVLLRASKARINRFDLAADDWLGKYFKQPSIRRAYSKDSSVMLPAGVNGYIPPMDIHDTHKGYTLEFGTKNSTIRHIIYQKFRESEGTSLAVEYPSWMRWEVRFYRQNKVAVDLLICHPKNWASAWIGSCRFLQDKFKRSGSRFVLHTENQKDSVIDRFVAAYMAIERQYGSTLSVVSQIGLRMPSRPIPDDSPMLSLTSFDKTDIERRLANARAGSWRSSSGRALPDDSDILF